MKTITKKVTNTRLKIDINLHVVNENVVTNLEKKSIQGQVQSFKSELVLDAMQDNGQLAPALISSFIIENVDFKANIQETINNYVDSNIDTIVSR